MNNCYAIFDTVTGRCVQMCQGGSLEDVLSICGSDQSAIPIAGLLPSDSFYVEDGTPAAMPTKPSQHHTFNWTARQWEDLRTLDDLKAAQWGQIKKARANAEYSGFTWDGSIFDSDATSQNRITGAVTLAQMSSGFSIAWVLADNTTRILSQTDMMQVGGALGIHVATQFAHGVSLRAQIDAATTPEQVLAIVW